MQNLCCAQKQKRPEFPLWFRIVSYFIVCALVLEKHLDFEFRNDFFAIFGNGVQFAALTII